MIMHDCDSVLGRVTLATPDGNTTLSTRRAFYEKNESALQRPTSRHNHPI
jgi:hypothetical protein